MLDWWKWFESHWWLVAVWVAAAPAITSGFKRTRNHPGYVRLRFRQSKAALYVCLAASALLVSGVWLFDRDSGWRDAIALAILVVPVLFLCAVETYRKPATPEEIAARAAAYDAKAAAAEANAQKFWSTAWGEIFSLLMLAGFCAAGLWVAGQAGLGETRAFMACVLALLFLVHKRLTGAFPTEEEKEQRYVKWWAELSTNQKAWYQQHPEEWAEAERDVRRTGQPYSRG